MTSQHGVGYGMLMTWKPRHLARTVVSFRQYIQVDIVETKEIVQAELSKRRHDDIFQAQGKGCMVVIRERCIVWEACSCVVVLEK